METKPIRSKSRVGDRMESRLVKIASTHAAEYVGVWVGGWAGALARLVPGICTMLQIDLLLPRSTPAPALPGFQQPCSHTERARSHCLPLAHASIQELYVTTFGATPQDVICSSTERVRSHCSPLEHASMQEVYVTWRGMA